jgi:hypothetical protein
MKLTTARKNNSTHNDYTHKHQTVKFIIIIKITLLIKRREYFIKT